MTGRRSQITLPIQGETAVTRITDSTIAILDSKKHRALLTRFLIDR
jgi:hypothetical protein